MGTTFKKDKVKHTQSDLLQRQSLPLEAKIQMTKLRIREFADAMDGDIYVSFSGGKDSTVLLDLVRSVCPDTPAVFSDTGLEYPEIREFVRTIPNVIWLKPKKTFKQVVDEYGYPVVSKDSSEKIHEIRTTRSDKLRNKRMNGDQNGNGKLPNKWRFLIDAPFGISPACCDHLKKNPFKRYEKESGLRPIVGTMAGESRLRHSTYIRHGCNSFGEGVARPMSAPMSFWTEQDVWDYIELKELPYSDIYNKGYDRTGCMFCMFGVHLEKGENRFQRMKRTHPDLHAYCMDKLGIRQVLEYIGVKAE